MNLLMLYFSGTGNTAYVVKKLEDQWPLHEINARTISMEHFKETNLEDVEWADCVLFAYPVYGSMAPMLVWDFVYQYGEHFKQKKAAVIATQWQFSGDGGAYLARILRKHGMQVISIEHMNMFNNISDFPLFKIKSLENEKDKIDVLNQKIELYAIDFARGRHHKIGDHISGILLGCIQRIPFSKLERKWSKNVKIDKNLCNLCGICIEKCPRRNLSFDEAKSKVDQHEKCTLCYRCVNLCPQMAISILSHKKPKKQYKGITNWS